MEAALNAAKNAYSPYSRFKVGAALATAKGGLFTGCNVENASFGLTNCAERSAIFNAINGEGKDMRIAKMAVFVSTLRAFPPCGACRQVISEFANEKTILYFITTEGLQCHHLEQFLPFQFKF
jgi:cytidine deaminase